MTISGPDSTRVVAILGPTGSGKAELAVAAASSSGALLLSCDSMKVYRGMDVGTAKPIRREGWLGLDLVDPWERFDASRFRATFDDALARARAEGRALLLSGGTMLYLKAATEGLAEAPARDPAVRDALVAEAEAHGSAVLHARLAATDPTAAARIHPNDLRRLVRALEVQAVTGRTLTALHAEEGGTLGQLRAGITRTVFVLRREREDMDARIDERVLRMLRAGWVEECERLLAGPRLPSIEAAQAIGYAELFAWLRAGGRGAPPPEVVTHVQTATRRFARKQLTWLKHVEGARVLDLAPDQDVLTHLATVREALGLRK